MTIKFFIPGEEYGFMSNFSRHEVTIDNIAYPTSEHYYQSQKFISAELQNKVLSAIGPGHAAKIGRDPTLPLREDWNDIKDDIMRKALKAKFTQNLDIKQKLLDTGCEYLIENSPKDWYWGIGSDGTGKNMLGRMLMEIREELS